MPPCSLRLEVLHAFRALPNKLNFDASTPLCPAALASKLLCPSHVPLRKRVPRQGEPPPFLQVLILRSFKSNDFASADSRRVTDAFCVSAESKAVMGASIADPQQPESMRSAKRLAGFAGQVTSPGYLNSNGKSPLCAFSSRLQLEY